MPPLPMPLDPPDKVFGLAAPHHMLMKLKWEIFHFELWRLSHASQARRSSRVTMRSIALLRPGTWQTGSGKVRPPRTERNFSRS
jgi:hypothetical protein